MRANDCPRLCVGDWVTLSTGRYASTEGQVVEVMLVHPLVGRARLRLPSRDDYWHPFWNEPMNDAEWRCTNDAAGMERFLRGLEPAFSPRKWMLVGCGLARLLFGDHAGLEVVERYADAGGRASALSNKGVVNPFSVFASVVAAGDFQRFVDFLTGMGVACPEAALRSNLLREIFGNPFRPPCIDPAWLAWESGQIPRLAREIYDARRFADMPVLGDALEDAGCADADLLAHCRSASPHVRGCWALDALLGLHGDPGPSPKR
jgi:hypothetical protein